MADLDNSALLIFYLGGKDFVGRTLEEIILQTDDWLEETHDFIQWLFPTNQKSQFNNNVPVLDEKMITYFSHPDIKFKILRAFQRMLKFYGLKYEDSSDTIDMDNWETRKKVWLTSNNHNFLRITRILTCLRLVGLENMANVFLSTLQTIFHSKDGRCITFKTFLFWSEATQE